MVLAGCSRRDQPKLLMLSLNDVEAMVAPRAVFVCGGWSW